MWIDLGVSFLYENSRLLDSMVKGYNRVQGMRAEDNLLGSTTANTQLSLSLKGGEEIVDLETILFDLVN